ncbi:MAG: roadblock/LC7 domain-containing protein [Micromonosporaceae bacterium]|nr:roadblock/LC7 domain-containing protein [Micromonosporaceae bacterium]
MTYPPTQPPVRDPQRWGFLLDRLCEHGDIVHAVAVASDGLKIATSRDLEEAAADRLSAVTSGMSAMATPICHDMRGGAVTEILIGMEEGSLLLMRIDDTALLTLLTTSTANMGQVAVEAGQFIHACGQTLVPSQRRP